ncbi:MAG: hypothetical protein MUF57_01210 [Gammaproteobacteria bacterium]|nr:hypothetical protein [Gammaproteobacteria bacterium]
MNTALSLPLAGFGVAAVKVCETCGGAGWAWGCELAFPPEYDPHDCYSDDTKYTCDWCDGKGRIAEDDDEVDPDWWEQ